MHIHYFKGSLYGNDDFQEAYNCNYKQGISIFEYEKLSMSI